jgi:hypothetical protein
MSAQNREGDGLNRLLLFRSKEVTQVKHYLVVKMVQGLDRVAGLMALPGLYTLEAAQQLVSKATDAEPGSNYLIQEVGAA